jgi:hypothetical protein
MATGERQATMPSLLATAQTLPGDALSGGAVGIQPRARSIFAGLPLIFEPNRGQANLDVADSRAKFVTRGAGYSLFLGSEGAILSMASRQGPGAAKHDLAKGDTKSNPKSNTAQASVDPLQMKLAGANPNATLAGADLLPGKSNYFLGNDPSKWRTGVPQFAKVRYENIYPGINLVFYGNQGRLEYDFQVAPGSDPAQAELEFNGAKKLELKDGALVIRSEGGSVQLQAPRVYQEIAGRQDPVEGSFVLRGANRAGFAIGAYDHSRELVIDPVLSFSSYFGGSGDERATSVAVDGSFNIYLAGSTTSPNLPAIGVFQTALAAGAVQNVYIAKITPPLSSIAAIIDYVTYLGGNGTDTPVGIKVDGAGNPYVAGTTTSSNFPTTPTTAYQSVPESTGTHVFVTKLQNDATILQYSSYLSGNGTDTASGMTIDASGYLYVTGTTTSGVVNTTDQFPASTLPYAQPFQNLSKAAAGLPQFFVTKVNTTAFQASSIAYSTYFGGGTFETTTPVVTGGGIAVDTNGIVYFTGTTNFLSTGISTTDFPILNAYQPCLDTAPPTTIVNPPLPCSTTTTATEPDAFVAKLNLNQNISPGQQLIWSTYLGGTGTDSGAGVAIDTGAANVYVVGTTNSIDIGIGSVNTANIAAYQRCLDNLMDSTGTMCTATAGAPNDAFVARLTNPTSATGTLGFVTLNYFSYLGGGGDEAGLAIAVDSAAGAVVTGWTQSTAASPFPVSPASNPIQSALTGFQDAFMARLDTTAVLGSTTASSWANYFGGNSNDGPTILTEGTGVALDVNQNAYFAGDTNSTDLQVLKPLVTPAAVNTVNGYNGGNDSFVTQLGSALSLSITGILSQGTTQSSFVDAGNAATFTYTVQNNGPDLANGVTILANLSQDVTGVPLTAVTAAVSGTTCGGSSSNTSVSCALPALQAGSTAIMTVTATPTPPTNGANAPTSFNGGTVQAMSQGSIVLAQASVDAIMTDFTMQVSPANNSVTAAGNTAFYQVQLFPHNVYSHAIALSCTGLPTGAGCTFTTPSVTLLTAGSSTLNVTTTARPVVTGAASWPMRHFYAMWLAVPGLTLLGVGVGGNRRRRRILGILMFCATFALLLLLPACSSTATQAPVSGTPAGNYTITVTGTSGTDTKSTTITLTVP